MAAQLKSYFPLNVEVKHLSYLIAKLNHYESGKKSLSSSPIDFKKPTSKNNLWCLYFDDISIKNTSFDVTILEINYQNFFKEKRSFWFHTEGENDHKCMILPLNLENMTLLKKLNEFFGGKLFLEGDMIASFKGKMKDKYHDGDEKFYEFYNFLNTEKPLTRQDHLDALNQIKIPPNYHQKLQSTDFISDLALLEYEEVLSDLNFSNEQKKRPKV